MRAIVLQGAAAWFVLVATSALATVRYVDVNNAAPAPPYTNWASSATTIQDAIDVALADDEIVVTNGVYAAGGRALYGTMTNRVAVDKPVTVRSVNGPAFTFIQGHQVSGTTNGDGAIRCAYLTNGAALCGFTLTNGATRTGGGFWQERNGGGLWCESANARMSNCVISRNSANLFGGGAYGGTLIGCTLVGNSTGQYGGGVYFGELSNCTLTGNSALNGGGAEGCVLNNCTLTYNTVEDSGGGAEGGTLNDCRLAANSARGDGAGASEATLHGCTLTGNGAGYRGGGAFYSFLTDCEISDNNADWEGGGTCYGTLNNCTLAGNSADEGGGAAGGTLNNCTLTRNSTGSGPADCPNTGGGVCGSTLNYCTLTGNSAGEGGGAAGATLNNCTLSGNSAFYDGGGAYQVTLNNCTLSGNSGSLGGGAFGGALNNCIVFYNTAVLGGANYNGNSTLNYCCTTPLPPGRSGNFTNAPRFVDLAGGDLRLQSNSPCINAGLNAYAPAGPDLDGHPRIVGGTVDVGAYEFQTPTSLLAYAWLQQYGLPTDGSADYADSDGDGLNNWQEWRAGTDPTNALSVLRLMKPVPGPSGVAVSWRSVDTRTYFLERSTNLGVAPIFLPLSSNIVGQAGATALLDTNAAGLRPLFYRVGVQE
jgi:hypothetical protein